MALASGRVRSGRSSCTSLEGRADPLLTRRAGGLQNRAAAAGSPFRIAPLEVPGLKFQDYYQTLGVARAADADAIKKAYRKLAMQWHPDRQPEAEREAARQRFVQISEAYEVLSDSEKRARYDQFGEHWREGQEFRAPPGAQTMSPEEFEAAFGGGGGFSDFFRSMFGNQFRADFRGGARRHPRYAHRGADVRANLELKVGDAVRGGVSSFEVGAHASCPVCGGVGFVDDHVCPRCAGVGQVRLAKTVELRIPDDVRDGQVLRMRGLGEAGAEGGEAGDLLLTLRLADDDVYRLRGADVEADVWLAPWEALAGASVDVRTARGTAVAKIPPGTAAGTRLRLRGQGLATADGGRGDLIIVVRMALPAALSERQRELLQEAGAAGPRAAIGGARTEGSQS